MLLFNLYEELEQLALQFKEFIINNSTNPLLWIGLFLGGLFIFKTVFYALNKNK